MADFKTVNLAEIYGAADNARSQQLQNQMAMMQMQKAQRDMQDEQAVRGAYAFTPEGGLDEKTTLSNLYKASPQRAYEFQQALTKRDAEASKLKRDEESARLGNAEKVYNIVKQSTGMVMANPRLDVAIRETQRFGQLTGQDVTSEIQNLQQIGDNPEELRRWAAGHALSAEQLLPKANTQDLGGQVVDRTIDPLTGKATVVGQTAKTLTPGEIQSGNLQRASQAITMRGQNMKDAREKEANTIRQNAVDASANKSKNKGLSVTAQKELFEAEDGIQGSKSAIQSFNKALELNDKAMGGYGSGALATAGTVLPEGLRPSSVDATRELDNVLQSAALPQLKAIFGGMPTEGERAILLEVQGSSAQPASVRKGIFERAKAAAEKRIKYNQEKAKQLRDGTYFTEEGGINTQQDNSNSNVIDFGSLK